MKYARRRFSALILAAATVALTTAAGCGGDDSKDGGQRSRQSPAAVFVGKVDNTDAYIAVLSNGSEVIGYLCDGKKVSNWFRNSKVEEGRANLIGRPGKRLGTVTLLPDEATGEILVEGARQRFSARRATGKAGLYRRSTVPLGEVAAAIERGKTRLPAGAYETGWIVLADGSFRGARSAKRNLFPVAKVGGSQIGAGSVNPPPPPPQPQEPQCEDLVDNDNDGREDIDSDPGCESFTDDSESPDPSANPECEDLADNDNDGREDIDSDPGCESATDNTESPDP